LKHSRVALFNCENPKSSLLPSKEKSHEGNVTEITPNVSRISTFHPEFGIQFNQFLVADEEPFIMHTGMKKMFPTTLVESS